MNYAGMNTSPVTRMAIAGLLREELVNARDYLEKSAQGNADVNLHYEAWRPVFAKEIPLKAHVHRVDDIFTAIRIAKEFDLNMTLLPLVLTTANWPPTTFALPGPIFAEVMPALTASAKAASIVLMASMARGN